MWLLAGGSLGHAITSGDADAVGHGTDERVSAVEGPLAPVCNAQREPHLARWRDLVVAGWVDDRMCDAKLSDQPFSVSAWAYSTDGGDTWQGGDLLRPEPGGKLLGDPVLAADRQGTFYYAQLAEFPTEAESTRSAVAVARSTDGGRTFGPAVDASPGRPLRADQDKPWMVVDTTSSPHSGNVYVAWTEFPPPTGSPAERAVLFSRSTDGGQTYSDPVALGAGSQAGVGVQLGVGPRGEAYAAWTDYVVPNDPTDYRLWSVNLWFTRSLDGGRTWADPVVIARPTGIGHIQETCVPPEPGVMPVVDERLPRDHTLVLDGAIRVRNWLSMAVDTTGSADPASPAYNPYHGRVYIALPHARAPSDDPEAALFWDEADVALIYSETRGQTWEGLTPEARPALLVNDNTSWSVSDQFNPQVAVGSDASVAMVWYDRRPVSGDAGPNSNWDIALYGAISRDGGETFTPNGRISDVAFPPPLAHNPFRYRVTLAPIIKATHRQEGSRFPPTRGGWGGGCNSMGEYNGLVAGDDGDFLVAWGDNRELPTPSPNGMGVGLDQDIYFDRIRWPS